MHVCQFNVCQSRFRLYDVLRDSYEQALDTQHAACLAAGDVSGLHAIYRKNPWHVPTLLSLAEVHFFSRANDETGQDMVQFAKFQ